MGGEVTSSVFSVHNNTGLCLSRSCSNLGKDCKDRKARGHIQHEQRSEPCKTTTMAISVWLKVQSLQCTTSQDVVPEASNQMQYSVLELTDRQMPALLCMVKRSFDHRLILRTPCTVLKGLLGEQAHGRREKFCLDASGENLTQ